MGTLTKNRMTSKELTKATLAPFVSSMLIPGISPSFSSNLRKSTYDCTSLMVHYGEGKTTKTYESSISGFLAKDLRKELQSASHTSSSISCSPEDL